MMLVSDVLSAECKHAMGESNQGVRQQIKRSKLISCEALDQFLAF